MCLGVINFGGRYGKPVLEECCRRAIDCGKTTYTFIKNTISAVADEMGTRIRRGAATPTEKGGYAMSPDAATIDRLLSRSRELADRQRGGGQ